MKHHLPAGTFTTITPASAGWDYAALSLLTLQGSTTFETGGFELLVLPLAGSCTVSCDGETFRLDGRDDVFSRVTDFAYVPRGSTVTVRGEGRFALPAALCEKRLTPLYGRAEDVPVEVRGAGRATRQVNNFCTPATFEADKMIAVEVITPGGNWSSFPPHKHDEASENESRLEEVYYFEADSADPAGRAGACGYQRVYGSGPGKEIDVCAEVRTGDAILIPYGWHGPAMAAPGYDLYYLNVMAGPDPERVWKICDDPAHAWVRTLWDDQEIDSRLPLTTTVENSRTEKEEVR
jgi:5-deoxy-glucuronate isomerase